MKSLANAEANAVSVEKDRITSHRLSLSLSLSLQTDVATYRAAYGLSLLSIISVWLIFKLASGVGKIRFQCHYPSLFQNCVRAL